MPRRVSLVQETIQSSPDPNLSGWVLKASIIIAGDLIGDHFIRPSRSIVLQKANCEQ